MSEVVEEKPKPPESCKGCLWIKDNECRYEGDHYDDFDVNIDSETGLGGCHSTVEGVKEVDWSKYE